MIIKPRFLYVTTEPTTVVLSGHSYELRGRTDRAQCYRTTTGRKHCKMGIRKKNTDISIVKYRDKEEKIKK